MYLFSPFRWFYHESTADPSDPHGNVIFSLVSCWNCFGLPHIRLQVVEVDEPFISTFLSETTVRFSLNILLSVHKGSLWNLKLVSCASIFSFTACRKFDSLLILNFSFLSEASTNVLSRPAVPLISPHTIYSFNTQRWGELEKGSQR
jgi:hypothetical protein